MYLSTNQEDNENRVLLEENEKAHYHTMSSFAKMRNSLKKLFNKDFTFEKRIVKMHKKPYPRYLNNETNLVDNTKYTWFNFIFLFLYYEFSQFSNFYYLLLCITQFIGPLQVGLLNRF